jgi:cation diffusion facilitator CzcD-associated flavoprotein CzcO
MFHFSSRFGQDENACLQPGRKNVPRTQNHIQTHHMTDVGWLMQAVVGAGAAGLVTARELQHEGHIVTVFEQDSKLGGVWNYSEDVESDLLGLDPCRQRIHSSLYSTVRTNLPREIMSFSAWPFVSPSLQSQNWTETKFKLSKH